MMGIQTEKDNHIGALFPRVHVSETRVPGPRAPPRNKMALFEQFTIPPHRFVPPLVQEDSCKVNPQSGGQDSDSSLIKPKQVKLGELSSKESDVSCRKAKCEALKCSVAELHVYSKISKSSAACDSGAKDCSLLPLRPPNSPMQKVGNHSTAESEVAYYAKLSSTNIKTRDSTVESRLISLSTERMATSPCGCTGIGACETDKLHALCGAIAENHLFNSAGASDGNGIADRELLFGSAVSSCRSAGISLTNEAHVPKGLLQVEKITDEDFHDCIGANDMNNLEQQMVCSDRSSEVAGNTGQEKHIIPLGKCDKDRRNLDFLPKIIPKHVIGVIGQREFWEARKTMLQQQKTLSVQVFELHRLIEVQRLIAAMPGHLLEGKDKCFVVEGSTQPEIAKCFVVRGSTSPEIAKVSDKLVMKESLNKEARHCGKPKQVVKGPKKPMKLSSGGGNTTINGGGQNPSLQVPPLKPTHVSLDGSRVSTWDIIPTWVKAGSHNYGLCRGPMAFEPPASGQLYDGQQVLQNGYYVFTNWSRPCNFLPKYIPEVYNPPLACQKLVNGSLIHQLDCAPGVQTTESLSAPNQSTSMQRKSSYSTLNPSSCAQHIMPNINYQQEACSTERLRSSGCRKLACQLINFTGDLEAPDKAESMSVADSCEFQSERSGLGFQTFRKMVSTRGNESETFAQPSEVGKTTAVTERYTAHQNDPLFTVCLENVSSVQKGEKSGLTTSKVIRAVPHPASEAVQAAAKILKSIQQSESSP